MHLVSRFKCVYYETAKIFGYFSGSYNYYPINPPACGARYIIKEHVNWGSKSLSTIILHDLQNH